jgi:hypothetical protein
MRVFWFFVLCLWSDQSKFVARFYGSNLWNVPGFIFGALWLLSIFL